MRERQGQDHVFMSFLKKMDNSSYRSGPKYLMFAGGVYLILFVCLFVVVVVVVFVTVSDNFTAIFLAEQISN